MGKAVNGPMITKWNAEWFERVCPQHITQKAEEATKEYSHLWGKRMKNEAIEIIMQNAAVWSIEELNEIRKDEVRYDKRHNKEVYDLKARGYIQL
jgi:hypothetical protein